MNRIVVGAIHEAAILYLLTERLRQRGFPLNKEPIRHCPHADFCCFEQRENISLKPTYISSDGLDCPSTGTR